MNELKKYNKQIFLATTIGGTLIAANAALDAEAGDKIPAWVYWTFAAINAAGVALILLGEKIPGR